MNTTELLSKQNVHRGEVYYIVPDGEVPAPGIMNGGRPGVIVSNDMNNECNGVIEVVYLSRHPHNDLPTNVRIFSTGVKCWAICGQIQTVAKRRVGKFVNQLDDKEMENINRAMALGLDAKLNMSTRDVQGILEDWKNQLTYKPDEIVLTDALPFDTEGSVTVAEVSLVTEKDFRTQVQKAKKNGSELLQRSHVNDVNLENNSEYIKVCAERDTYKNMYEAVMKELLAKR